MSISVEFTEDYSDSREISISRDSFSQRFKFHMCGDFYEEAEEFPPYGKGDDTVALSAAYSILPPFLLQPLYSDSSLLILVLSSINLRMIHHDNWEVEAEYSPPDKGEGSGGSNVDPADYGPQVEDGAEAAPNNYVQLAFNVSATTANKKQSLTLLNQQVIPGITPPVIYTRYLGAPMGQTHEGVEGGDVYSRGFSFNVTTYKTPIEMSFRYVRKLYRLATTLNDRPFFGFPPGSVIFLEAQAQGDIFSVIPVTFEFQMQPNFVLNPTGASTLMDPEEEDPVLQFDIISDPFFAKSSDLDVSTEGYYTNNIWKDKYGELLFSEITTVDGPGRYTSIYSGWDFVDYRYTEGVVDGFGMVVKKPVMRFVHNNYFYSDFADLELGHLSIIPS